MAMAAIAIPTNVTLVMGYLKIYEKFKNEFGSSNGKYIERNQHRFLDDIYIALDANNINALRFFDILNNIHEYIKVTVEQCNFYLSFYES